MTISTNKKVLLFILLAFIFSFSIRLIWVYQFSQSEQFKFNNEFMINTNDGYYWAEGARDIISATHQENDLSPITGSLSLLTAYIVKILPIQFETIIFYMPAFFASLIVIPIMLIAREIDELETGFIAALLGSIAWSYYNRTMVGYFDTDMLNIVLPMVLLWSVIWAVGTKKNIYLLITAIDILLYRWWYPQSVALEFSFVGLVIVYALYQFIKIKKSNSDIKLSLIYTLKLISIMLVGMMIVDGWVRFVLVIILFYLFTNKKFDRYIYYVFLASIILFLFTGGISIITRLLEMYVFRNSMSSTVNETMTLHFYSVMQTVKEAGKIPFETFANRVSGHTVTLILSVIGYIWLVIRHKIMLLALPMVGLGFLAYGIPGVVSGGGLRFTIYAVPIMAFGIGYFIVQISQILSEQLKSEKVAFVFKYVVITLATLAVLYPNVKHIQEYKVPTVFTNQEVQVLDKLKKIVKPEDYAISWWDYGYPLRYYSDLKTLTDGGKHSGEVNFPVSFILNSPQEQSAKMARLDVEYTEKRFHLDNTTKWAATNIEQMSLDYGFDDANDFLIKLNEDIKLPKKTRDVYLYLPNRMLSIFPTIELFSNINLMNGEKGNQSFFYSSQSFNTKANVISLGNGINILKDTGKIQVNNQDL